MASSQSSQSKRPSQLSRSVSKALRTLGTSEEIQCTRSLIQAYNDSDDEDAKGTALHQWLEAYVDEFSKHKADCLRENWIREYALLAMINVKDSASAALVRRVYFSLRACIKAGEQYSPVIVVALDNMLRIMDSKIVAKEAQSLVSLANDLLCLTDPKKCIFTRDTYESHMPCLLTLERILIVLHAVECDRSKQRVVEFFQSKLRTHLKAIAAEQNYYPFVYSTQLIKHNIDGLIKGDPTSTLLNAGRRAFYAICGGLYLFQGIRELAVMSLDFAAIEAGMYKMHQAVSGLLDTKAPGLREVVHAASKSETTKDFSHILECYENHKRPSFMDGVASHKLKIVKFALVSHLTLFVTESSESDLSNQAFCLLIDLAANNDISEWRADSDIYECLLDALASIGAKRHSLRQDCLQLMHQMEISSIQNQQTVKEWRGSYNIEQKVNMMCDDESNIPSRSLYDVVRKQLDLHLTYASSLEHKQKLIEQYQDQSFAKVSLLFDDDKERHVVDFDFHNVVYELVDAENRITNNVNSTTSDQMKHNLERTHWIQMTIKLQDIFAKRRKKSSGMKEEVSRVLLLGNPGTGKTSLSKRLCYDWTRGEWGSEFERVYLLQVRQLIGSRLQLEKTLERAIAILLFNAESLLEEEWIALNHQIKDELDQQTTLLLIDGLDEANGNDIAEAIVKNALSRTSSVLILSRPHNLGDLRSKVDVQIECLGLNTDQLKTYVQREVHGASDELIQFLERSPLVWEIAKVPVNAQIICTIWNSEARQRLKEWKSVNLKSLYSSMTKYAWQRFVEKTKEPVVRDEVLTSLEIIAFASINQSKVEIPLELVMKHSQGTTTRKLLLDSGFLLFHKEGQVFQFAHLSFQEFFAERFLAKKLRGSSEENKVAKKYIAERKYFDTSRVTLSFMSQCYCQEEDAYFAEDCIEKLKQLFAILDKDPVEVIGFQHILLNMRTLDAFLSISGSHVEEMRSDKELQGIVSAALKALDIWVDGMSQCMIEIVKDGWQCSFCNQMIEELGQMPSLFAYLPEFLSTMLKHHELLRDLGDISSVARLASFAPEQRLSMMPVYIRNEDCEENRFGHCDDCLLWFMLFAESGPDCAVLVLDQLKTACESEDRWIRSRALRAVSHFLKALPEREDLHSICIEAMKVIDSHERLQFLRELGKVMFKPNSAAANLALSLTMEATRDENRWVQYCALDILIRDDMTSETSNDEMIKILQEFLSGPFSNIGWTGHPTVVKAIHKLLRRVPAKLTLFLPYLARYCNSGDEDVRRDVAKIIEELPLYLPTPQKRELGEMISSIYWHLQSDDIRQAALVSALYDMGQKVPDFMTDFREVFAVACSDTDAHVRNYALVRRTMAMLWSVEGVDAVNEVFWDQSFSVKVELLRLIHREGMINAETAKVVMEMVEECTGSSYNFHLYNVLLSLSRISCLSNILLHSLLRPRNIGYSVEEARTIVHQQPLDRLIEYFCATVDKRVVHVVAQKLILASVTYKAVGRDKSVT